MIDLNDVLLAMSNIPVDDPIAEIWGRGLQGGYKIIEYTGSLPITIRANGDALLDYRIYGADGGVGEPTDIGEPAGYKLPITVGKNLYNAKNDIPGYFIYTNGKIWGASSSDTNFISEKIPVAPGRKYTLYYPLTMGGNSLACAFYSESNEPLSITNISSSSRPYEQIYDLVAPANAAYFQTSIKRNPDSEPITLFAENVHDIPVYIGENQLGEDEYVSFSDQKIYKRTENLLNSKIIGVAQKVKIEPNTEYVLSRYASLGVNRIYWSIYNESDKMIGTEMYMQNDAAMRVPPLNTASYIMITIPEIAYDSVSIVKGTFINTRTAVPATYTPYVLPTEPSIPLPEIPTIDGETVIDYDGNPKPSQMYVKYKGKG